ncbi:MAG: hypothetical protein JWO56_2837 [Acidobacteria bacterium]|nr:hypothetical protein [Acidobacteriota bacterium]
MIDRREVEERARYDAQLGIYQPDTYVVASQGAVPQFDPLGNLEHANIGSHLQDPTIAELEEDIREAEDELARHPSALLLVIFLVLLLVLELAGGIFVMQTLGIENPERIVFGSALAICVFFTAWLASRTGNRVLSVGALIVLGVLVSALSAVRVDDNTGESESRTFSVASAIILAAVTAGPAMMAEHILRILAPALPIARRRSQLRRRVASSTRSRSGATRFVNGVARDRDDWQREATQRRAIYDVAHSAARAELGDLGTRASSPTAVSSTSSPANQPIRGH